MLRNRSLLGVLSAELVSLTGTSMTFVALPWFVLATTGSATKLGLVLGIGSIPFDRLIAATATLFQAAAVSNFNVPARVVPLASVAEAWNTKGGARIVFTPNPPNPC